MQQVKILAVDDEVFNLDLIEAVFMEHDHVEIMKATNGKEALAVVETVSPDVIITDIAMPVMDGFELIKALKRDPKTAHIPVIMVSPNTENELEALSLGAADFVSKPFDMKVLSIRTLNKVG
jgi:putative two-component system response regulator